MTKLILVLFILKTISVSIYSQNYQIIGFQGEYDELESYNSIILEFGNIWGAGANRIDLDFEFPFFDTSFNYIYTFRDGFYGFDGQGNNITLFALPIEPDRDFNIFDIQSDIRYQLLEDAGLKCLVVQYTKMRFIADPSIELSDSYLNFQNWFCEDGSMEVRFGEMNLENSPGYSPDEGFFLIFNNGDLLIPVVVFVGVVDLNDENGSFLYGTHEEFEIVDYDAIESGLKNLPPEGWIFRIEPAPSNTNLESPSKVFLFPNPAQNELSINSDGELIENLQIFDTSGRLVFSESKIEFPLNLSQISAGLYIVKFKTNGREVVTKLIKK